MNFVCLKVSTDTAPSDSCESTVSLDQVNFPTQTFAHALPQTNTWDLDCLGHLENSLRFQLLLLLWDPIQFSWTSLKCSLSMKTVLNDLWLHSLLFLVSVQSFQIKSWWELSVMMLLSSFPLMKNKQSFAVNHVVVFLSVFFTQMNQEYR